MKSYITILVCFISLISCTNEDSKKSNNTFLGGEIINPKWGYVLLSKNDQIIDTIHLDSRNRFFRKFSDFESGLYSFIHSERQLVHIEEGDSIMIRVNTIEFDESLSFSGNGAERSNFLIDMFLHWESENDGFTKHYQKEPQVFQKLLDSMHRERQKFLTKFNLKHDVSPAFEEIALASVNYDNFQRKESYPFSHYGKNKLAFIENLPDDFYSFRESVNLNNTNLQELYTYQRYINAYLDHEAYKRYGTRASYNTVSYTHNHNEIEAIKENITNTSLKDSKLYRTGRIFIANSNNKEDVDNIFKLLMSSITSEEVKNKMSALYITHKKMEAGNKIPDLMLVDAGQRMVTLTSTLQKPTVIYFWSYNNHMHMENSHKKAHDLQSKYPEFNFIGININDENDLWTQHLRQHKFDPSKEYRFDDPFHARRSLVITDISKTIVLDKKGKILNSHANLHRSNFEDELLAYLNQ